MRDAVTSFSSTELEFFIAVEIGFDEGTERFWNGLHDVTIGTTSFYGIGNMLSISEVEETSEIAAKGITVVFDGLDSTMLSAALNVNYQNRPLNVYVGAIESGTFSSTALFKGRMDTMAFAEAGETTTVSITAESRLIDLERARSFRYTSEDQKALYSGDLGLDYVADLQDKVINWGRS
jgi:hypothetical protein